MVGSGVSVFRRCLDIAIAGVSLLLLAPLMLAIAALVRVTSPGPALFRQVRLTTGRREFTIYKFRTMRVGADGPHVTAKQDARVTGIGRFLRKTSLDELPQLINILQGTMTLVGPRPETPALAAQYPPSLKWILDCTPGLTGPTQIRLRDAQRLPSDLEDPESWYLEELVPQRVAVDLTYLRAPTARATIRVLVATASYLVTGNPPAGRHAA